MSKARELLMNSRVMQRNEGQENKSGIPVNSNENDIKIDQTFSSN